MKNHRRVSSHWYQPTRKSMARQLWFVANRPKSTSSPTSTHLPLPLEHKNTLRNRYFFPSFRQWQLKHVFRNMFYPINYFVKIIFPPKIPASHWPLRPFPDSSRDGAFQITTALAALGTPETLREAMAAGGKGLTMPCC